VVWVVMGQWDVGGVIVSSFVSVEKVNWPSVIDPSLGCSLTILSGGEISKARKDCILVMVCCISCWNAR